MTVSSRAPRPDFLIVGAPKAGTTALHSAIARHPDVFMTSPKEAKYFLCDDAPPPHWRGPGDKHSQQEWIWRRSEYEALFAPAPAHALRGESTPFYLWSRGAHRRIASMLPEVKLIAVVRDPIDRAYSNWMHLWSDGLEPVADFTTAFGMERARIEGGYAPFWHYRDLGLYGEQLQHLYEYVDPERVLVMRYRELIDDPAAAVDRACCFLGLPPGHVGEIPVDNGRLYAEPGWRTRTVGPVVRGGAWLAQFAPPQVWRRAAPALIRQLRGSGAAHRPLLAPEQRAALIDVFAEDIALLTEVTGQDFAQWLSPESRGSFRQRATA
ncbi:sulfotransferase family protein [Nocardioides nematodiphilus]|uniref:sulfotransferase family protein n=1 Tax=Nocardioides nematodiphilus TaxID=2849669 RepID=UPI001CD92E07|nr:sulfotransferase [Nocardioides nematodiphilus]MCA1983374.1 sulfotransferase [Nocardioides nematodiphilus]